jgi:S-DNA-T family DNA segregation ATPase FtsK/SpoIIIE
MPTSDQTVEESMAPEEPLALPRHPVAAPRPSFPLLAVLAPLVGAVVLFAVVRSPYMLAFAALSPVIALASTIDARLSARRRRRKDARVFAADAERFLRDVSAAHDRERAALDACHPTATAILADPAHRPRRWAEADGDLAPVRLGTGRAASRLAVSGSAATPRERELLSAARVIQQAPIVAAVAGGVGLIGVLPVARAALRGLVVQLAHAHPPGVLAISAPPGEAYDWLDDYPHAAPLQSERIRLRLIDEHAGSDDGGRRSRLAQPSSAPGAHGTASATEAAEAVIAVAERVEELPAGCRLVVAVDAAGRFTVLAPPDCVGAFDGELVTAQDAAAFGRELAVTARARGVEPARPLPSSVRFADLPHHVGAEVPGHALDTNRSVPDGLPAVAGIDPSGPLVLDLVSSGPHAIVTGTTGSGKSELLITWVLAMAATAPPARVCFLLVDFKGGTAFRRLGALPHTVGVVTDLEHGEAARALKSLRAELRRREAELARRGLSDVSGAGDDIPRLVIVVDEAAAMLAAFPDLAGLFVDIAARGRALGVHLILSTQRATGVVGDGLLANCALRLSLRLTSDGDSTALLGTVAAARLPHGARGRVVVAADGGLVTAQVATVTAGDVESVARVHARAARPRAPWLPALPARIPLTAFGRPGQGCVVIGAGDDPDRQVQEVVLYRPARSHLLVLGTRASGKSHVLATIRAQWCPPQRQQGPARGETSRSDGTAIVPPEVIVVPPDVEGAWDAVQGVRSRLRAGDTPARDEGACLVLIDDVDALIDRFADEYRDALVDAIRAVLVDGPHAGIAVTCTATTLPAGLRSVQGRFGERLLLRQSDRQEHVLAGAPAELWDASAPPGRGVWRERAVQVALAEPVPASERRHPSLLAFPPGSITLVVTRAPGAVSRLLRDHVTGLDVVDLREAVASSGIGVAPPAPLDSSGGSAFDLRPGGGEIDVHAGARPVAVVGDPDAWQSRWSTLNVLRSRAPLVFDGCTLAQVRAIVHARVLPPPTEPGHVLVCDATTEFSRARLPS